MLDPSIRNRHDDFGNAAELLSAPDLKVIAEGTWFRAAGECACPICHQEYWRHPLVPDALWLHRICTGWMVHL